MKSVRVLLADKKGKDGGVCWQCPLRSKPVWYGCPCLRRYNWEAEVFDVSFTGVSKTIDLYILV